MKLCYEDRRVAVYDSFLKPDEHRDLLEYLDRAPFRDILPADWGRAFRLGDGRPLAGDSVASRKRHVDDRQPFYPTGTALDRLFGHLFECRTEISSIAGTYSTDWSYFTLCPYVYPIHSGLGWHADPHCAGSLIYYAHSEWRSNWGGELMVAHTENDCIATSVSARGIIRNVDMDTALADGTGLYLAPTPNRMIFLRGSTPHMIKPVEPAAGDNLRLSISGFFLLSKDESEVTPS